MNNSLSNAQRRCPTAGWQIFLLVRVGIAGTGSIIGQSVVNYSPTNEIFRNPERSFYTQFTGYSQNTQGYKQR
jgi:hypothetical protein